MESHKWNDLENRVSGSTFILKEGQSPILYSDTRRLSISYLMEQLFEMTFVDALQYFQFIHEYGQHISPKLRENIVYEKGHTIAGVRYIPTLKNTPDVTQHLLDILENLYLYDSEKKELHKLKGQRDKELS